MSAHLSRGRNTVSGAWAAINSLQTSDASKVSKTDTVTQGVASSLNFGQNKKLTLTSNTPGGGISRLVEFHMTTEFDRPWISWFDENNLHRVSVGYHTTDAAEGGSHQAFELKSVAADQVDMRTRFSIGTKTDRVLVGFNFCDTLEVNQGEAPASVTQFGLQLRGYKRDGSAHAVAAQFMAEVQASNGLTTYIDSIPLVGTAPGQIVLMKSSLSTSASTGIYIKTSNSGNPNGDQFVFKNRTGVIEIYNAQTIPSGNIAQAGQLYSEGGALKWRGSSGTITILGAP